MRRIVLAALLLSLTSLVLGATVFRSQAAAAAAAILPVVVTNDAAHPVPVHEQGTANVNVNGTVPVAPKLPANAFSSFGFEDQTVGPSNLPAGSNWYISEVSGANCSDSKQEVSVVLETSSTAQRGPNLIIPAQDTVDLTFPQPFTLRQEVDNMRLEVLTTTGCVVWTIVGYHD
jgi:hypothetical protein